MQVVNSIFQSCFTGHNGAIVPSDGGAIRAWVMSSDTPTCTTMEVSVSVLGSSFHSCTSGDRGEPVFARRATRNTASRGALTLGGAAVIGVGGWQGVPSLWREAPPRASL